MPVPQPGAGRRELGVRLGAHLEANAAARACAVGCQTVVKSYKCVELYRSVNVFPVLCILFLFFYVGLQLLILSLARRIFCLERTSRRWQPLASDHCVCQPVRALWLISTISIFTRTYWGLARGGFVTFGFYFHFHFRFRFCFCSCQAQLNEGHSV